MPLIHEMLRHEMAPRQAGHPENFFHARHVNHANHVSHANHVNHVSHARRRAHARLSEADPDDPDRWSHRSSGGFRGAIVRADRPGRQPHGRPLRSIVNLRVVGNGNQVVLACDSRNSDRRLLAISTL